MPYDIARGDVYRVPSGRFARVQSVEGVRVTLAYVADPSPAADPVPDGDSVTLRADFVAGASSSALPLQYPCRLVAAGESI